MPRPPVIAPTIVRYTMRADINSRACDNLVDISLDEIGTTRHDAVTAMGTLVVGSWQDRIIPALGSWYRFHGAHYVDLDSLGGVTGDINPIAGKPTLGGASGSQHTPNTAALIHKQSGQRRNTRKGRMYLAPILETDTDDGGTLSGGAVTRFQTAVNAFKSDVGAGILVPPATLAWRVVHVISHTGTPVPGFPNGYPDEWDSSDVSSLTVDPVAATQRRRLR